MDASSSSSSSSRYRHTCIPSVVPPGVDPTSVDFRTFFPYIPNEVKHRKRTSRPQLKVLEDVYRKDTKPNAAVRKKLAAELDMLPRAVQVWFQNRRAKDKQLRKRAAAQHLQTDESNTTTATAPHDEHQPGPISSDLTENLSEQTHERESPRLSPADFSSFAPDSSVSPTGLQQSPPATPVDALHLVDPDLYNARRGSLPTVLPIQNTHFLPPQFIDRRKSLDVNCYRLMQHPYATVAREKNEALLAKSPLSPPGSTQALTRPSSTMGPIRSAPLPPYAHPSRTYRASEPHVFTPLRGAPFLAIAESSPVSTTSPSIPPRFPARRSYENRPFAFASRAPPPSIPGPLPRPDFQFGESSSNSPQNASPEGDTPLSSSSGSSAQASSPDMSISLLHRWSFPRGSTTSITSATSVNGVPPHCSLREGDGDAEDTISTTPSSSMGCLSRFGSVASVTGSESSVMFSDVSSCVAVDMGGDPGGRRGSCGSGQLLETRMSGLNVNYHQNHGNMGTHPPSGYTSSSTMSPSDRHSPKETSSLSCPPLSRSGSMYEFGGIPHSEIPLVRRGSMPPAVHAPPAIPEQDIHLHPHNMYVQDTGAETKYSMEQWTSGSGDYATQSHQHFSPQDARSFVSDTPTTGPANGAYPRSHHQHLVSHQFRHHTHTPTDLTYSSSYHLQESVVSGASALGVHGTTANGYVVDVPVPSHSGASLGGYAGNGVYHGQEAWGL